MKESLMCLLAGFLVVSSLAYISNGGGMDCTTPLGVANVKFDTDNAQIVIEGYRYDVTQVKQNTAIAKRGTSTAIMGEYNGVTVLNVDGNIGFCQERSWKDSVLDFLL